MSGEQNRSVYDNYLRRKTSATVEPSASNSGANKEYTTETLSNEINDVEMELLQNFLSLSFLSNNIERTIIDFDDDGKETPDSFARRRSTLEMFRAELKRNKDLKDRVEKACPGFSRPLIDELSSEEFQVYTAGVSTLKKLCGSVNTIGVYEDEELEYETDDGYERYIDHIETRDDMLSYISENLDSIDFERATLIERRFIKQKIGEFKEQTSRSTVEAECAEGIDSVSKENDRSLGYLEKYSKHIETKGKKTKYESYYDDDDDRLDY